MLCCVVKSTTTNSSRTASFLHSADEVDESVTADDEEKTEMGAVTGETSPNAKLSITSQDQLVVEDVNGKDKSQYRSLKSKLQSVLHYQRVVLVSQ